MAFKRTSAEAFFDDFDNPKTKKVSLSHSVLRTFDENSQDLCTSSLLRYFDESSQACPSSLLRFFDENSQECKSSLLRFFFDENSQDSCTSSLIHVFDEKRQDSCTSSVGSNHPIYDVIVLSDDEDDEVVSPPSVFNGQEAIRVIDPTIPELIQTTIDELFASLG